MPSFSSESSSVIVRAASDHFSLRLKARHCLVFGSPSHLYSIKSRFPEGVDVLLGSDLVLTLSGVVDRVKVSNQDVSISAVASHLVRYFKTIATQVGLNAVSDIYIDENDDLPKLTLTSSRRLSDGSRHPHATLVSIDLRYIWNTTACHDSVESPPFVDDLHPFSPRLLLPVEFVLNQAVEKFASLHLVQRYPLIFGPWCKKLDIEATFFSPIFHSIFNVMKRSSDLSFRKNCKRLVKTIVQQHSQASSKALSALYTHLASITDDSNGLSETASDEKTMTDEEALHLSMERLYRTRIQNPIFKGFVGTGLIDCDSEDELNSSGHASRSPDYEILSTDMDTCHHAIALEQDESAKYIDGITLDSLSGHAGVVIEEFGAEGEDGLLDFEDEPEDVEFHEASFPFHLYI